MKHNTILLTAWLLLASGMMAMAAGKKTDSPETVKLKNKISTYMKHVEAQTDWLTSRLQMYWHTHATDVFLQGEAFSHPGGERAGVPTVKFAGTRGTESKYNRPKIEDLVPYDDDEMGNVTYINAATGVMEKAHPSKTGCNISSVNRQIMGVARDAALVYKATGEENYGKMAADVLTTYMKGIAARHVPTDLNHGHQQTLVGMATFEVIHEEILNELTQAYPLVKNLIAEADQEEMERGFKLWADNIIANGVPHNNWNLFQADFVVKIACILQPDKHYADGHGKEYYLNEALERDHVRQWSIGRLLDFGFDQHAKTWYESPGYSITVVGLLADFANRLDETTQRDLFERYPIMKEAVMTLPQYLFPNRMPAGFGDTHPGWLPTGAMDKISLYAKRHNDKKLLSQMNDLKQAVQPDAPAKDLEGRVSTVFYAPNVSWLVLRTGMDRQHSLMASLNGSLGNHQHANGLSLELYGKGYVLGPDAGIGKYLYSGLDYLEYYSQMPAHNTVVVDGVSSYPIMMSQHPFKLVASSPEVTKEQPASSTVSERPETFTYATTDFIEPETNALQRRTVAVVKTSDKGGFYIDVFRSKRQEGGDKTHDYFYHNLGQQMSVAHPSGTPFSMKPTEELAFAGGHLYAYSYIYNKVEAQMDTDAKVEFVTRIDNDSIAQLMDGQHEIKMTMWMKQEPGRTIFQALSPANLEYERMPRQPYDVASQPVLTFVARQQGEAWRRPFVAVYEPSSDTEPGDVAAVNFFSPSEQGAVGVEVTLKDGRSMRFVCKESGQVEKM